VFLQISPNGEGGWASYNVCYESSHAVSQRKGKKEDCGEVGAVMQSQEATFMPCACSGGFPQGLCGF